MAKGDFGSTASQGTMQGSPMSLAALTARLRATQGGGMMGPGQFAGGMMPGMGNTQPKPMQDLPPGNNMQPTKSGAAGMPDNMMHPTQSYNPAIGMNNQMSRMFDPNNPVAQGNTGIGGGVVRKLDYFS